MCHSSENKFEQTPASPRGNRNRSWLTLGQVESCVCKDVSRPPVGYSFRQVFIPLFRSDPSWRCFIPIHLQQSLPYIHSLQSLYIACLISGHTHHRVLPMKHYIVLLSPLLSAALASRIPLLGDNARFHPVQDGIGARWHYCSCSHPPPKQFFSGPSMLTR
jgi:hypothetical protein